MLWLSIAGTLAGLSAALMVVEYHRRRYEPLIRPAGAPPQAPPGEPTVTTA